jgi:hypothetical protein
MADLSTTAASNYPTGSDSPTSGDDYLRSIQAIIRSTNAKGADIASATTTNIGAATGEFVDVTGTTTITGLGTIAAGIVRTVRFTGALTLTHNATSLILPGSANITTANGDVAQFRSLGSGNWKCVGYIKSDGTAVAIADNSITTAKLAFDTGALGFRNKIIGGDFTTNPWQRGTSFTAPANNAYTADRFKVEYDGTVVFNVLKAADSPTATQAGLYTQHSLHIDITTADAAMAATEFGIVIHNIEGLNTASFGFGQTGTRYITLSFWHKHTKTGIYCVAFRNSAIDRSYIVEYTQAVSDVWEKATITIPVDTTGTWLYDSGKGLSISFTLASGSNYQTTANTWTSGNFLATANQVNALDNVANDFKIALVQLEAGSIATPFETHSFGTEFALCKRYYQVIAAKLAGYTSAGTSNAYRMVYSVQMRATPTATVSGQVNTNTTEATISVDSSNTCLHSSIGASTGGFISEAVAFLSAEL